MDLEQLNIKTASTHSLCLKFTHNIPKITISINFLGHQPNLRKLFRYDVTIIPRSNV